MISPTVWHSRQTPPPRRGEGAWEGSVAIYNNRSTSISGGNTI